MKLFIIVTSFVFILSPSAFGKSVEEYKTEIIELALANTANTQNRPEIRRQLNILVSELTAQTPLVTELDWSHYSPGSWRQIWADEADNSPAGSPKQNLERIFQYVEKSGRAVNLGERLFTDGTVKTFALEAIGTVNGNSQTTEILKAFVMDFGMQPGQTVKGMARDILQNKNLIFQEVQAGVFPDGPIGAKSDLKILFLDNTLKIGTAPNVYTGDIEMFVLQRQNDIDPQ